MISHRSNFVKRIATFIMAVVFVASGFTLANAKGADEDIKIVKINDSNF